MIGVTLFQLENQNEVGGLGKEMSCPFVHMDNKHNFILSMEILMHRENVTKSWSPLSCHSSNAIMFKHDNARPHVTRIYTQFLQAENVPVLPWPVYHDISPIEHVWDALDRRVQQRVPVPANIQKLCIDIEEEWDNISQATIISLINSMWRRCVTLHDANVGHTRYGLVFWSTLLPSFLRCLWLKKMHIFIHSHVKSID